MRQRRLHFDGADDGFDGHEQLRVNGGDQCRAVPVQHVVDDHVEFDNVRAAEMACPLAMPDLCDGQSRRNGQIAASHGITFRSGRALALLSSRAALTARGGRPSNIRTRFASEE